MYYFFVNFSIGHDNKGVGAGWHLSKVTILSESDDRVWISECNRWLADDADDRKVERLLDTIEFTTPNLKSDEESSNS